MELFPHVTCDMLVVNGYDDGTPIIFRVMGARSRL
jgi:hypothetical protein